MKQIYAEPFTQPIHVRVIPPSSSGEDTPAVVLARRDVEHYRAQIRLALMADMGRVADVYGTLLREAEALLTTPV